MTSSRLPEVSIAPSVLPSRAAGVDPVRYCVLTTVALIAWAASPAVAVTLTSGIGLWAYARAWRAGLRESRCVLRDPRLVLAYLGVAFCLGLASTVLRVAHLLG